MGGSAVWSAPPPPMGVGHFCVGGLAGNSGWVGLPIDPPPPVVKPRPGWGWGGPKGAGPQPGNVVFRPLIVPCTWRGCLSQATITMPLSPPPPGKGELPWCCFVTSPARRSPPTGATTMWRRGRHHRRPQPVWYGRVLYKRRGTPSGTPCPPPPPAMTTIPAGTALWNDRESVCAA